MTRDARCGMGPHRRRGLRGLVAGATLAALAGGCSSKPLDPPRFVPAGANFVLTADLVKLRDTKTANKILTLEAGGKSLAVKVAEIKKGTGGFDARHDLDAALVATMVDPATGATELGVVLSGRFNRADIISWLEGRARKAGLPAAPGSYRGHRLVRTSPGTVATFAGSRRMLLGSEAMVRLMLDVAAKARPAFAENRELSALLAKVPADATVRAVGQLPAATKSALKPSQPALAALHQARLAAYLVNGFQLELVADFDSAAQAQAAATAVTEGVADAKKFFAGFGYARLGNYLASATPSVAGTRLTVYAGVTEKQFHDILSLVGAAVDYLVQEGKLPAPGAPHPK